MHLSPMGKPGVEDLQLLAPYLSICASLETIQRIYHRHDTPGVDFLPATYSCVSKNIVHATDVLFHESDIPVN